MVILILQLRVLLYNRGPPGQHTQLLIKLHWPLKKYLGNTQFHAFSISVFSLFMASPVVFSLFLPKPMPVAVCETYSACNVEHARQWGILLHMNCTRNFTWCCVKLPQHSCVQSRPTLLTGAPCSTGYSSIAFLQQFLRTVSSNGLLEALVMLLLCSVQQAVHFYLSEKISLILIDIKLLNILLFFLLFSECLQKILQFWENQCLVFTLIQCLVLITLNFI